MIYQPEEAKIHHEKSARVLPLGLNLSAVLPTQEIVEGWKAENRLEGFRSLFASRIVGLLRVIPNPIELKNEEKWSKLDGTSVFHLDFDGRRGAIKGDTLEEFLAECERSGVSLPSPSEVRDYFWKKVLKSEHAIPRFEMPLDPDLERELSAIREELQWYVEHLLQNNEGNTRGKEEQQAPKESGSASEIPKSTAETLSDVMIALAGEKAKRIIAEAETAAQQSLKNVRAESEDILRSTLQQCEQMLSEAREAARAEAAQILAMAREQCDQLNQDTIERLQAALGFLSPTNNAQPSRNPTANN